jgi:hypothetical protein
VSSAACRALALDFEMFAVQPASAERAFRPTSVVRQWRLLRGENSESTNVR